MKGHNANTDLILIGQWTVATECPCFEHVYGFSQCYNEAEKASIPAALMCYNNHVVGPRVVLDVSRAKESITTYCVCTVTSDTPTKFNFFNYNNYHPGTGCGSALIFSVNGEFHSKQCFVDDDQLPSSNHTDTSVDISIPHPQSTISTDYCVLIESGSYTIPVIGVGLILVFAIIIAACYNHR
uniref:Uncharacterized protein n=1 Tax=Magallana gigas TaxID=29159 RepID=K1QST3_MAGGI